MAKAPEKPSGPPVPTVGYDVVTGEPKTFELVPGEPLPKGWVDSPDKVTGVPAKKGTLHLPSDEEDGA